MSDEQAPKLRILRMLCDPGSWHDLGAVQFTVADVMSSPPITVESSQPLGFVIDLLTTKRFRHVLVTEEKRLTGIISDRDVLRALKDGPVALVRPAKLVATEKPQVASPNTSVEQAASILLTGGISALPVVNGREPVGIVTTADLLWLLRIGQMANGGFGRNTLRTILKEIEDLASKGFLREGEADELTSNLVGAVAAQAPKSPAGGQREGCCAKT